MPNGFDKTPRNSFERWLFDRDDGLVSLVEPKERELLGHVIVDHANKHVGFIPKEALYNAENCIRVMKEWKTYNNHKIGRLCKPIQGLCITYEQDEIVIYRTEDDKTVTVETPMTPEELEARKDERSLITAYKTIVAVPKEYVQDIPLPD